MHPSDYGYATSGGATGRGLCLQKELHDWNAMEDCYLNNWMASSEDRWTINPNANDYNSFGVQIYQAEFYSIRNGHTHEPLYIVPSIYLKQNVMVIDGDGTKLNPYILQ